jgi:DNA-binding response OmpR family regulator
MNAASRQRPAPQTSLDQTISVGRNVLLVDSDLDLRFMLSMLLREEGHRVTTCGAVTEAVQALQETKFDFIITAHSTPGIDGLCLLEIVKQYNSDLPVVVISARHEKEPYIIAMNLGALDYLIQPLDYRAIQRLIQSQT